MTMNEVDFLILGQGLAGTTLAWHLRSLQRKILIVDREARSSASQIAAGLITPITGQRFTVSWRFDELWSYAKEFYRRLEADTGTSLLDERPAIRLFASLQEQQQFHSQYARDPSLARYVTRNFSQHELPQIDANLGGFEMSPAAQVDLRAFLSTSRERFRAAGEYERAEIDPNRDLRMIGSRVAIARLGIIARRVIFCQGVSACQNSWFDLSLKPARGDILRVLVPGIGLHQVIHRDIWVVPNGGESVRIGATFERVAVGELMNDPPAHLDVPEPSPLAEQQLLSALRGLLTVPHQVVAHQAAFRPTLPGRLPQLALHGQYPQLGCMNGLGSKGSLRAPWVARQFANYLVRGTPIPMELAGTSSRGLSASGTPRRLTEVAQDNVRAAVNLGDVVIDATAGNGHDTIFLAKEVGPAGLVFAFDIQDEALRRCQTRLGSEGIGQVRLVLRSHAELEESIEARYRGRVSAVMFNLGYLPRGEKQLVTHPKSTLAGLAAALRVIQPGGVVTVLAYTGHPGGQEEADQVQTYLEQVSADLFDVTLPAYEQSPGAPRLYVVRRRSLP